MLQVTELVYHQAKVTSLDWAADSKRFATGSLDCKIIIWDVLVRACAMCVRDERVLV